ncbi:glutamyl-tRNA reductase [Sediminibacterium sp. TEGAF015]|uniref:glutamyl-tRNA reductase n=1 Tax=Sediminibacterium sp. TEGAF015 TaxID=575378 RepID=UPI0021FDA6DF|nr:glutamyl-tRNA reductase [Sediminibacterium sp. TEGAF015]BDQ13381.1 glutamyl-tRNA reductase [Sediminibacterium sp. TEGAF015]
MEKFLVAGVNYKKTILSIRSKFSISEQAIKEIYTQFKHEGRTNIIILSTCNRTEIYGYGISEGEIKNIFEKYTAADKVAIEKHLIVRNGREAIQHLCSVSAGLESQIIGDYEIAGQLRSSFKMANEAGMTTGLFQKILETSLQASKSVRTQTNISDGTTSTSYAVIQHLKKYSLNHLKICLIGWGKIGLATFRNIRQHLPDADLTIVNRSLNKLLTIDHAPCKLYSLNDMEQALSNVDVAIIATAAEGYLIRPSILLHSRVKIIFDLSVPSNISPDVRDLEHLEVYNVDDLSIEINKNLDRRSKEIPLAMQIINTYIDQLYAWQERKKSRTVCS